MSASFLNPSCNADILYEAPLDSLDDIDAFFRYNLNYLKGSMMTPVTEYRGARGDSTGLITRAPKAKIKKEAVEPVTGGEMWTWSNGFRVIFNRVEDAPALSYAFVFGTGYGSVEDLQRGEAGYFSDILALYETAGISGDDFYSMLAANGVELKGEVGPRSTVLKGTVLPSRLPLLLRSVLSLVNDSSPSLNRFQEYCEGERLRLASRRTASYRMERALFDAVHSEFPGSPYKDPALLQDGLLQKADRLLRGKVFPAASKGYLVISGDIDPFVLRKVLASYVGGFGPAPSSTAVPSGKFSLASGRKFLQGDLPARVCLYAECEYPLTGKTHYLSQAVGEAARRMAVQAAGPQARDVRVVCREEPWPQERLSLRISFALSGGNAKQVADDILQALGAAQGAVSKEDADAYKAMALSAAEASMKTPEGLNDLAIARYTYNKDYKTRYKENINSITPEDIAAALAALSGGTWAIWQGNGE